MINYKKGFAVQGLPRRWARSSHSSRSTLQMAPYIYIDVPKLITMEHQSNPSLGHVQNMTNRCSLLQVENSSPSLDSQG
jgi:hypothetical protein